MKAKYSLDDLALFYLVAQHGGLNLASQASGIALATLSRRLKNLEKTLGCRLLERSAHHFSLTAMGQHYFTQCGPLLVDLQTITKALDSGQDRLSGALKITAPVSMTQRWLGQCFFDFMQRYPQIHLELVLSNRYENLVGEQFDAAFRVGEPRENNWIARHVWTTHMGFCASPKYLAATALIQHPQDLLQHRLVVADPINEWELQHATTHEKFTLDIQPYFRTNDIGVALDAVAANIGLSLVPNYYFINPQYPIQDLVPVLPQWQGRQRPVYLLYRDRDVISARLRAFIDHVLEWMNNHAQF